jgi:hypothetical protein
LGIRIFFLEKNHNPLPLQVKWSFPKTNCILEAALDENNKMHNNGQHCWVSCIYYILKELDMLKMFKSPLTCGAREINITRKKLKER